MNVILLLAMSVCLCCRCCLRSQEEQLGGSCALPAIRSLDVSSLRIRDVGSVFSTGTPFSSLAELVLDNNAISSLASLAGLTALAVLKVSNNRLGEADPACISFGVQPQQLQSPPGLAVAGASPCTTALQQQAALQPLLPNLQMLHIGGNGLTSLRPLQLQYLPALHSLFIQGNELQRLDGLEGLAHLKELVADRNKIRCVKSCCCAVLSPVAGHGLRPCQWKHRDCAWFVHVGWVESLTACTVVPRMVIKG